MVLPNIFNNPEFWITTYLVDQGTHTVTAPGLIWKGVDVNLTAVSDLSVTVKFSGAGAYYVPEAVPSLTLAGINFVRETDGPMFVLKDGTKAVRFDRCNFSHVDATMAAVNVSDSLSFPHGLQLKFVDCKFNTAGPAVTATLSRSQGDVSIEFVNCEFSGAGSGPKLSLSTANDNMRVSIAQVNSQYAAGKTFDGVNVTASGVLVHTTGAALALTNVDFANITAGDVVHAVNTPSVEIRNCRIDTASGAAVRIAPRAAANVSITGGYVRRAARSAVVVEDMGATNALTLTIADVEFTANGDATLRATAGRSLLATVTNCSFSDNVVNSQQSGGSNGVIDFTGGTMQNQLVVSACTFARTRGFSVFDVFTCPVNVTRSTFADNAVDYTLVVRNSLLLDNVTFHGTTPSLARQSTEVYVERTGDVELRGVDASRSSALSVVRTDNGKVVVAGAASTLQSIHIGDASALTIDAPLSLLLCKNNATTQQTYAIKGGLVAVGSAGALSVFGGRSCDAFDGTGTVTNGGSITLRSTIGSLVAVGFTVSRDWKGAGTLNLGIRGSNVGEIDSVKFTGPLQLPVLNATVALNEASTMVANNTVFTLLTFPAGSTVGTVPVGFEQTATSVTYKVVITCANGCNNGECVGANMCKCRAGWTDSAAGFCDQAVTSAPVASGGTNSTPATSGGGTAKNATPDALGVPIEILAPAVAGGVLLIAIIILIICCVVRRKKRSATGGGSALQPTGARTATFDTGTGMPSATGVTYGSLPSDRDRIASATGKQVIDVQWEGDSDEE